tara:strand:+ start:153 stop:662 length:510 start_codon:yes stop_codon:yes gene_type:complete
MIYIGHVAKTHGLHGHLSIKIDMPQDMCQVLDQIKTFYISKNKPIVITNAQLNNKIFLRVKIKSINNREDAKKILRQSVFIKKGEHSHFDNEWDKKNKYLDFKIYDKKEGEIGSIEKIDFNRPQPLFIVKKNDNTILIPFVDELITNIDLDLKVINVELPENLIQICNQ